MGSKKLDSALQNVKRVTGSPSDDTVEVSQLNLGRKTFDAKMKTLLEKTIERRVQKVRGYPILQFPKRILDQLGVILNGELYIEYSEVNILHSELKIRLFNKRKRLDEEPEQRDRQSQGDKDPDNV